MKKISSLAAIVLGLAFIFFGINFWAQFSFVPKAEHSEAAGAMIGAMYKSGYLTFVKLLEIIGGAMLLIPRVRAWGLLIIGPILLNILCIGIFMDGKPDGMVMILAVLALLVAYGARQGFCCLACCGSGCCGANCCNKSGSGDTQAGCSCGPGCGCK